MSGSGGIVAVLELSLVLDARVGGLVEWRTARSRKREEGITMRCKARADP